MRRYTSTKVAVLAASLSVAALLAASSMTGAARRTSSPATGTRKDSRTLREKAATGRGKFIGNVEFNRAAMKGSLAQLAGHSSSVVVAVAESNVCKLSADGRRVTTDYQVRVEQTLKGRATPGDVLTVSLPGGKVGFEDGSTVEVQTMWFKKMLNGRRYLLFLDRRGGMETLVTTGGPQGVFELPGGGQAALSHSLLPADPIRRYNRMGVDSLLDEIRRHVTVGKAV